MLESHSRLILSDLVHALQNEDTGGASSYFTENVVFNMQGGVNEFNVTGMGRETLAGYLDRLFMAIEVVDLNLLSVGTKGISITARIGFHIAVRTDRVSLDGTLRARLNFVGDQISQVEIFHDLARMRAFLKLVGIAPEIEEHALEASMHAIYNFRESANEDLSSTRVARLFCDMQHLNVIAYSAASLSCGLSFASNMEELAFGATLNSVDRRYRNRISKYDLYIDELSQFDDAELEIRSVSKRSPLRIVARSKRIANEIKNDIPGIYKALVHLIHAEADRRRAEVKLKEQEVFSKTIENMERALNLSERLRDPRLKDKLLRNAISAIEPFCDGSQPPVDSIKITVE